MTVLTLKRWLFYTHRWLGMACSVLFAVWFVSGVVMMYARMPRLTAEERLMRLPPLDLSTAGVTPAEAATSAGYTSEAPAERLRVAMLQGRPVYRFARGSAWRAVFADDGDVFEGMSAEHAVDVVRAFVPEHAATIRHDRRLEDADQWTLSSVIRAQMPLHRVALGDEAGTEFYVSDRTGEAVMKTDARGRFWGWLGAVLHWVYFTPFRRHAALWAGFIIYSSLVGCVMCLTGLAAGLWRWKLTPCYRLRGVEGRTHSPYAGFMWWHHYAGLLFGVVTFTWILSGLFSMNPWDWSPGSTPTQAQRRALAGGPLDLSRLDLAGMRDALTAIGREFPAKELDLVQFDGASYYAAYQPPSSDEAGEWSNTDLAAFLSPQAALDRRIVRADGVGMPFESFDRAALERLARTAMPGASVVEAVWLDTYDAYYYDRHGAKPLPVLRVKFDDPQQTWLYADPQSGTLVAKEERLSRLERWLYQGLHSLDFPGFYTSRPMWDIVLIGLSVGGTALSVTAMVLAWRRGRRWARRLRQYPIA